MKMGGRMSFVRMERWRVRRGVVQKGVRRSWRSVRTMMVVVKYSRISMLKIVVRWRKCGGVLGPGRARRVVVSVEWRREREADVRGGRMPSRDWRSCVNAEPRVEFPGVEFGALGESSCADSGPVFIEEALISLYAAASNP